MSYDYSPEFFADNKETLDMLEELMKSGGTQRIECDSATEFRKIQRYIRNCLAAMIFYRPDMKEARLALRTWVTYEKECWVLNIGRPTFRIRGSVPNQYGPKFTVAKGVPIPEGMRTTKSEVKCEFPVTRETWSRFTLWLAEQTTKDEVKQLRAEFPQGFPLSSLTVLEQQLGWSIDTNEVTKWATFTRRKDDNPGGGTSNSPGTEDLPGVRVEGGTDQPAEGIEGHLSPGDGSAP